MGWNNTVDDTKFLSCHVWTLHRNQLSGQSIFWCMSTAAQSRSRSRACADTNTGTTRTNPTSGQKGNGQRLEWKRLTIGTQTVVFGPDGQPITTPVMSREGRCQRGGVPLDSWTAGRTAVGNKNLVCCCTYMDYGVCASAKVGTRSVRCRNNSPRSAQSA